MIFIQKYAITCRVGLWNKQMPYFSSVSDEWSRDLKSVRYRNSVHVEEEEAKELLELSAERLETEQRQKLEQQEQLSIEKLRFGNGII
ncbi:hypothetical protein TNCV_1992421 [Trichonephila clavipes]|nr:hypothetical protein TNCV_1992421 [Trichonephila clavipes]